LPLRIEDDLAANITFKIILVYYVIAAIILLSGYFSPTQTHFVTYIPVLFSIVLLIPLYVWQRNYRRKTGLTKETVTRDKGMALFCIFALFAAALSVRIPSALEFNMPYEKTPLIYLLVLTILVIEKTDLSAFGFRTENLVKSHLYGLAFFAILAGLALTVQYALIYFFVGQVPVQSYDFASALLSFPFMTFCVGISEEALFRGYMQTHLERLYSSKLAILTQAILFGSWHFVWNLSPFDPIAMAQYIATTFLIGLVFGYFYSKSRNLVPLIFAHGLWNSIPPWIIENGQAISYFETFPWYDHALVLVLPFAISAIATVLFIKYVVKKA
jgi:membrane protease YdiL (CAAX protease family)